MCWSKRVDRKPEGTASGLICAEECVSCLPMQIRVYVQGTQDNSYTQKLPLASMAVRKNDRELGKKHFESTKEIMIKQHKVLPPSR